MAVRSPHVCDDETAHAVPDHHDPARMDARHAIGTFRAQANDRRSSILKAMGEGEGSRAAPRSAIMKRQYVSPGPAHGLS
jgi:hypothetical protein